MHVPFLIWEETDMEKQPAQKNELKDAPLPTITNDPLAAGSPHPPFGKRTSPEEKWEKD